MSSAAGRLAKGHARWTPKLRGRNPFHGQAVRDRPQRAAGSPREWRFLVNKSPATPGLVQIRDALGLALSDALGSLDECESYLSDDVADGLIDNFDEAQSFARDALF